MCMHIYSFASSFHVPYSLTDCLFLAVVLFSRGMIEDTYSEVRSTFTLFQRIQCCCYLLHLFLSVPLKHPCSPGMHNLNIFSGLYSIPVRREELKRFGGGWDFSLMQYLFTFQSKTIWAESDLTFEVRLAREAFKFLSFELLLLPLKRKQTTWNETKDNLKELFTQKRKFCH